MGMTVVVRRVAMAAAFTVNVRVRFVAMTAGFTMAVTTGFAMTVTVDVFIGRLVGVPFVPVGTGFGLIRTVCFGLVRVRHRWLPGSICGLVNTLKPLQGQGRNPEGP
ncbi:hypothetical protein PQQ52_20720 [Paraburkholderia sediminicola]|uniref:hypothetical protein n=1 Tax=Paraburkholderia sediminicola TaxID=458836 RepID=UPI0038BB1170